MQNKAQINTKTLDKMESRELRTVGGRLLDEADAKAKKELVALLERNESLRFRRLTATVSTELCIVEGEAGSNLQIPIRMVYELERDGKAAVEVDGRLCTLLSRKR